MITKEEVYYLAGLSNLSLSEQEIVEMQNSLQQMLIFVNTLQQLNTDGIEPFKGLTLPQQPREDILNTYDNELLLQQAPQVENNYIVVPNVLK